VTACVKGTQAGSRYLGSLGPYSVAVGPLCCLSYSCRRLLSRWSSIWSNELSLNF